MLKISDFISTLLILMLIPTAADASTDTANEPLSEDVADFTVLPSCETEVDDAIMLSVAPPDTTKNTTAVQGVQYSKVTIVQKEIPLFSGYGIYADLAGIVMAQVGKWGQYEAGAHFGIKGRYYPAVELGIGQSNYTNDRTSMHYKVHSPYFRVGMDYNLNKNRASRNRYFLGLRYGFSSFSYDLDGPTLTDDYWNQKFPYEMDGVKGKAHWGELLFGIQSQIWKFIHLGWTLRYKIRLHESMGECGHAYYIPGYGKNGDSSKCFGGTFNIVFEL